MTTETLIWLIPLPPVLAFFLIVLFTNRNRTLSHSIAIGAAFLSWLGSMVVFLRVISIEHLGEHPIESSLPWPWLPLGDGGINVGLLIDPLSAIVLFFVAWTVLMIFIYSVGYHNFGQPKGDHDRPGLPPHGATLKDAHGHAHTVMSIEPMYSRFFAFIGLFAFGMYTLVLSDNLLTLFVGWEIMGLCSYLLIGFWFGKPSARAAAIKAFLTTRVGDVFMLLGIAYLYAETGTLNFRAIFHNQEVLDKLAHDPSLIAGLSVAGMIGILLFIGTIGKSAQWPLHVWLPDAMEGPTPVSAMIHAATMVSAGVYMVIRMFPLMSAGFEGHGLTPPMLLMAIIGSITALFAATIAMAQNDIKRVLAYSTISQLGFMIAALGIGGYVAATFHLVTHAFFKALLFLGSGSVIHGMEHGVLHVNNHIDPQDMTYMGGLRHKMPITFWTFLIGGFALSGFPFVTAGFWSKDEILADAFAHAPIVFVVLALAALMTAFYTMRQITLTFLGQPRTPAAENAHETHWTMTLPLVVLSVFAISFGWLGIPEALTGGAIPNWFHEFVGGTLLHHPEPVTFSIIPMLTSFLVAGLGLWGGWQLYKNFKPGQVDPVQRALPAGIYNGMRNRWYFDELYEATFIRLSTWLSDVFSPGLDRSFDGILHSLAYTSGVIGDFLRNKIDKPIINGLADNLAEGVKNGLAPTFRTIQTGRVQQYMIVALVAIGAFAATYYFVKAVLPTLMMGLFG